MHFHFKVDRVILKEQKRGELVRGQEIGLEEVKSAVENQTVFDRDHFISNYDA